MKAAAGGGGAERGQRWKGGDGVERVRKGKNLPEHVTVTV